MIVVKVGGSLHDMPNLPKLLITWLNRECLGRVMLVPGGGLAVDDLRLRARQEAIDDETCHWQAIAIMTRNAQMFEDCLGIPGVSVLDAQAFALEDELRPGRLPHSWDVTSDSIAARVAEVHGAERLILLKSVPHRLSMSWPDAAHAGLVDRYFPILARRWTCPIEVRAFRDEAGRNVENPDS